MDPRVTPGASCSTTKPVAAAPAHCRPLPNRMPRTPGSAALNVCTMDEPLFARVAVHTAKCTECDKRNMDTMRRCPGCTFQVCQPCYDKRQREGKGLVHGNMPTPGMTGSVLPNGNGVRAVRKKPAASVLYTEVQEQNGEKSPVKNERGTSNQKPNTKKRVTRKTQSENSELEESSEHDSESDDTSPTPNKRLQTHFSFVESALSTAVRAPPTTLAAHRSDLTAAHQALTPTSSEKMKLQSPDKHASSGQQSPGKHIPSEYRSPAKHAPSEHWHDDTLYQHAIRNYHEPLLARCEPVLFNRAAHIPAIIKRGGRPRPTAEQIYQNIQDKVRAKLNMPSPRAVPNGEPSETNGGPSEMTEKPSKITEEPFKMPMHSEAEATAPAYTIRDFVEHEAKKYQDTTLLDEDDNKALFSTMQNAALVWGKHMYNKLDPEMQRVLLPGLNLRLDAIDSAHTEELETLMAEQAVRMLRDLHGV